MKETLTWLQVCHPGWRPTAIKLSFFHADQHVTHWIKNKIYLSPCGRGRLRYVKRASGGWGVVKERFHFKDAWIFNQPHPFYGQYALRHAALVARMQSRTENMSQLRCDLFKEKCFFNYPSPAFNMLRMSQSTSPTRGEVHFCILIH